MKENLYDVACLETGEFAFNVKASSHVVALAKVLSCSCSTARGSRGGVFAMTTCIPGISFTEIYVSNLSGLHYKVSQEIHAKATKDFIAKKGGMKPNEHSEFDDNW